MSKNKFKQTEIGLIPEDWDLTILGDITINHDSKRIPLSTMERKKIKGNFRYYGASSIIDYVDKYLFDGNFLIISEDGENLKSRKSPISFIVDGKFWVNNHAHIVSCKDNYDLYFLNSWFATNSVEPYLSGSVQPKLSQSNLNRIILPLPPLSEQSSIAKILSDLDSKIELLQQQNKTLENIGKTIFKHWFVDFEFPNIEGKPYKSSGGEMVESELGEIPEGWEIGRISKLTIHDKSSITPLTKSNEIFHHYSLPAYDNGKKPDLIKGVDILSNKFAVKDNSILFSKLNPRFPRIWLIGKVKENSVCSTEFIQLVPNNNCFSFICLLMQQKSLISSLQSFVKGTSSSHQRINPTDLTEMKIIIPSEHLLIVFENKISSFIKKIILNYLKITSLSKTRDLLLPKLMTGKIRVKM